MEHNHLSFWLSQPSNLICCYELHFLFSPFILQQHGGRGRRSLCICSYTCGDTMCRKYYKYKYYNITNTCCRVNVVLMGVFCRSRWIGEYLEFRIQIGVRIMRGWDCVRIEDIFVTDGFKTHRKIKRERERDCFLTKMLDSGILCINVTQPPSTA